MSWLSFIGNQPILSQWNESSREQDTDLYWKKLQLKNERDLLLYTAMLSDYSVFFFHKPSEVCMVFAAVAQPPSGIISDLLLYFWQLDAPTVYFFFFFFLNVFDCWKGKPWCFSFGSRDVWSIYSMVGREDTPLPLNSPLLV